jgi:SAM-dependent methyltransferase
VTLASSNSDSSKAYCSRRLEAIAERWDSKADGWDRELNSPSCHLNEDEAYSRFLCEVETIINGHREFCSRHGVLDLGCGTGLVLARVISSFAWGMGIDISRRMIQQAQAKRIPRAQFRVGDAFQLASLVPRVGAVFSRGVLLSHYGSEHAMGLFESVKSVLVERGILVVDFLNEAARGRYPHSPEHKTFYSGSEVRLLAKKAGFERTTILGEECRRVLLLLTQNE